MNLHNLFDERGIKSINSCLSVTYSISVTVTCHSSVTGNRRDCFFVLPYQISSMVELFPCSVYRRQEHGPGEFVCVVFYFDDHQIVDTNCSGCVGLNFM